ncbi:hypothetical protein [Paenibacillus sp. OAS669]|uniref:hypothetical protein n=1 Tax=Paenibacillus sp. OAS669 TaxID=2663821 RepID=UPI00178AF060|nr:hypothetical protein [Paenibacillus sp. OAS669]MBE1442966.1 hypothetical protein [Paenibacillus sp. OAS669]
MGNYVSLPDQHSSLEDLHMSNGLTSVFLEMLVLSGSLMAVSNREKEFIIWLAQRDQSIVGIGTVGFSLEEMPWLIHDFNRMKLFMLKTIEGAINKTKWEVLDYEPNEEMVVRCLHHFKELIKAFSVDHVLESHYWEWSELDDNDPIPAIPEGHPMCPTHSIYLSCHGCLICNSM